MDIIIKKNEAEINENVAKGLLGIWGIVLLICLLCWGGVFNISLKMTLELLVTAFITLVVPAVMVLRFHLYNDRMKYLIVTAAAALFLFVVPTIIAGFYMSRRLLYYSGIISVTAIITTHIITGVHLRQPWIEPFTGMEAILRYGAIPRCLQYLGCFLLIFLMVNRHMEMILHTASAEENLSNDADLILKKEFELILQGLTEREKSVFVLMVSGYTNRQIADKLCLSNGTVKNYISAVYEKIGTRERNALIMKYNRFVKEND